jgi:DNA-binding transcriptional LysR family regulator
MRDLNDLYYFAAVVKNQGFTAAARALGVPKQRISRRITILEQQLGVRLLERSTRHLNVTEIGREVYRHAQAAIDEAKTVDEIAQRMQSAPQGLVRISCPVGVQRAVSRALPSFIKKYPLLRLQFVITNRPVDLIDEGVDIAIRIRERLDTDAELLVRRIGVSRRVLVASKNLLRKHPPLEHPDDLRRLPLLHASERLGPLTWKLSGPAGKVASVSIEPKLSAGDFAILLDAAVAGVGLALLPEIDCLHALRARRLIHVLPEWSIADGVAHLVFPSRRGMLPSVRAVIDFLATTLKSKIGHS